MCSVRQMEKSAMFYREQSRYPSEKCMFSRLFNVLFIWFQSTLINFTTANVFFIWFQFTLINTCPDYLTSFYVETVVSFSP